MVEGLLMLLAIAGAIYIGYYYRTQKGSSMKKSVGIGCLSYLVLMTIASMVIYATMSDEEKAKIEAEQERKDSIETVRDAEKKAREATEDKKFRAYSAARYYLKEHLRDPDSYKEEGYSCTCDEKQQVWTVVIKYRAKNGFGGMNRSVASIKVLVSDKETVVIEAENLN